MEGKLEKRICESVHVTRADIEGDLRDLGLKPGDIVMVHSSLSSFGYVEDGADAVIEALLETMGPEGTVMVPTYSTNRRKTGRGTDQEILPYDPQTTPVWTGTIPETFRKRKEAIRSLHPTHSLTAIGPRAKELIESLHKLVEWNGYVLLLGVDLHVNSAMHLSEDIAKPPQYLRREEANREREVDGRKVRAVEGPWADFTKMEEAYLQRGIMKTGTIGEATVRLLKARPMVELFAEALRQNPDRFYS